MKKVLIFLILLAGCAVLPPTILIQGFNTLDGNMETYDQFYANVDIELSSASNIIVYYEGIIQCDDAVYCNGYIIIYDTQHIEIITSNVKIYEIETFMIK